MEQYDQYFDEINNKEVLRYLIAYKTGQITLFDTKNYS